MNISMVSIGYAVALVAAVLGAALTALATAVQQRATRQAPAGTGLNPRLLASLMGSPPWLASFAGLAAGYCCYLTALAHAPLILVQPIMSSGLVLGPLFAARLARRRLDPAVAAGGALCVVGLAALVTIAAPTAGTYSPVPDGGSTQVVVGVAVLLLAAAALGARSPAHGFALAAGGLFGVTAALTKVVLAQLALGWSAALAHWALYVALLTATLGFLSSQRSFQLSPLLASVNTLISVTDTVIALLIGVLVLAERTTTTPAALLGQVLALAATASGICLVIRRANQLTTATGRLGTDGPHEDSIAKWG
jgi:hypothetical protein